MRISPDTLAACKSGELEKLIGCQIITRKCVLMARGNNPGCAYCYDARQLLDGSIG